MSNEPASEVAILTPEAAQNEYKDASDNLRHFGNMRFANLTLLLAFTGGLLSVFTNGSTSPNSRAANMLKVAGAVLAFCVFVMEWRTTAWWAGCHRRVVNLEQTLGCKQYTGARPPKVFLSQTNAVRAIYAAVIVFWLSSLVFPELLVFSRPATALPLN